VLLLGVSLSSIVSDPPAPMSAAPPSITVRNQEVGGFEVAS